MSKLPVMLARPRVEYRTVETRTLAGLKQAERLHANGWAVERVGLFHTVFVRKPKPEAIRAWRARMAEVRP